MWLIVWSIFIAILANPSRCESHQRQRQADQFKQKMKEHCYDRLLFLACTDYCNVSLPIINQRRQIIRTLTNYSSQREIPFSVHTKTRTSTLSKLFGAECTNIVSNANAFVTYLVAQRAFVYEFYQQDNATASTSKTALINFRKWLNSFQEAADTIASINASQLEEEIEKQTAKGHNALIVLFVYSNNCQTASTKGWLSKFAESLIDRIDKITMLAMNIDSDREDIGWNEVFVQLRLVDIDLDGECPRLILIKRGEHFLDYHIHAQSSLNIYENQSYPLLRQFIVDCLENRRCSSTEWNRLGDPLTDIQYTFFAQENVIRTKLPNKKFVAIGTTGGIGVIALAVSIFWGLKSSSITGEAQTAIIAISAEENPNIMLATKRIKRTSSF